MTTDTSNDSELSAGHRGRSDTVEQYAHYEPDPGEIQLRESDDLSDVDLEDVDVAAGDEGLFIVRMPIASTGEVRNEGDDPLSRDEVAGMAEQINDRTPGVFLDHGQNAVTGSRYSALGKVGEWADAELVEGDGETLLEADARLMDPETLPAATSDLREALAIVKSQVERELSLSASIGWRTDRSMPGDVDLMEASLVGIPADPRTTSQDAPAPEAARSVGGGTSPRSGPDPTARAMKRELAHGERDRDTEVRKPTTFYYDDTAVIVEGNPDAGAEKGGRRRTGPDHMLEF